MADGDRHRGGTAKALLTGTAQPLTISPASSDFAHTFIGLTSTAVFQVTNLTGGPVGPIANAVPPGSGFTVAADGCAGKTIAAGRAAQSRSPSHPPTPSTTPGRSSPTRPDVTLWRTSADSGSSDSNLPPPSKDFGFVPVGTTASATFTVTNISPIPAGPIADALGTTSGFAPSLVHHHSDNCAGHTLAANASCTLVANFVPTSTIYYGGGR